MSAFVLDRPEQVEPALATIRRRAADLLRSGRKVAVTVGEQHDDVSARQRRYFHGAILQAIADQVVIDGQRYELSVWKEFYRAKFLGSDWRVLRLPGDSHPRPIEQRISTEALGRKRYAAYVERVIAHATTELGVAFDPREAMPH